MDNEPGHERKVFILKVKTGSSLIPDAEVRPSDAPSHPGPAALLLKAGMAAIPVCLSLSVCPRPAWLYLLWNPSPRERPAELGYRRTTKGTKKQKTKKVPRH